MAFKRQFKCYKRQNLFMKWTPDRFQQLSMGELGFLVRERWKSERSDFSTFRFGLVVK